MLISKSLLAIAAKKNDGKLPSDQERQIALCIAEANIMVLGGNGSGFIHMIAGTFEEAYEYLKDKFENKKDNGYYYILHVGGPTLKCGPKITTYTEELRDSLHVPKEDKMIDDIKSLAPGPHGTAIIS